MLELQDGLAIAVYGGFGGFSFYAIPNLVILAWQLTKSDGKWPKRFKNYRFYLVWVLSTLAGGLAAWYQSSDLQYFHQLCWQIGAAYLSTATLMGPV